MKRNYFKRFVPTKSVKFLLALGLAMGMNVNSFAFEVFVESATTDEVLTFDVGDKGITAGQMKTLISEKNTLPVEQMELFYFTSMFSNDEIIKPNESHLLLCNTANKIDLNVFPDENFRKYISDEIDEDKDGFLSEVEIARASMFECNSMSIKSLEGIQYFKNLQLLFCSKNQITSIDLSNKTHFKYLDCSYNQITSLDFSNVLNLQLLACDYNQITSLDFSNNTILNSLQCSNNQITSINIANNSQLLYLICNNNQLTSLDLSNNEGILSVYCSENKINIGEISMNGFVLPNVARENITSINGGHLADNTDETIIIPDSKDITSITYMYNVGNSKIKDIEFTVEFSINTYAVKLSANNDEFGTVSGSGIFYNNEKITISATSNVGYHFVKWSDGDIDSLRTITINDSNISLVAEFAAHNFGEWEITIPATCETDGEKKCVCSCGAYKVEAIPATGHDWSEFIYNNDATLENDGTETRYCLHDNCTAEETRRAEGTRLTAINKITTVGVWAVNKTIYIDNANAEDNIFVFDILGKKIATGKTEINVKAEGLYVVKVADEIFKIIVR